MFFKWWGLQEALFVTTSDLILCSFPFLIVLYKTVLYCIRLLYSPHEVGKWELVVAGHSERSRQRWLVTGSRISGRSSGRYVQMTILINWCNIDIWYIPIYHIKSLLLKYRKHSYDNFNWMIIHLCCSIIPPYCNIKSKQPVSQANPKWGR